MNSGLEGCEGIGLSRRSAWSRVGLAEGVVTEWELESVAGECELDGFTTGWELEGVDGDWALEDVAVEATA